MTSYTDVNSVFTQSTSLGLPMLQAMELGNTSFHKRDTSISPVFKAAVMDFLEVVDVQDILIVSARTVLDSLFEAHGEIPVTEAEVVRYLSAPETLPFHEGVAELICVRKINLPRGHWWDFQTRPTDLYSVWHLIGRHCQFLLGDEQLQNNSLTSSGQSNRSMSEKIPETHFIARRVRKDVEKLLHTLHESGVLIGIASPFVFLPRTISDICWFVQEWWDVDKLLAKKGNDTSVPGLVTYDTLCYQYLCAEMGVTTSDTVFLFGHYTTHVPITMANFGLNVALAPIISKYKSTQGPSKSFRDVTVEGSGALSIELLNASFEEMRGPATWRLRYTTYDRLQEPLREALTCIGNGYMGIRGCWVGTSYVEGVHYAGCYLAGMYNTTESLISGQKVRNTDLVNMPNWALIRLSFGGLILDPLNSEQCEMLNYEHKLDMKEAILSHTIRFRERANGRETTIQTRRVCNMRHWHQAAISYNVTAWNYSCDDMKVLSALDGTISNRLIKRYHGLCSIHLDSVQEIATHGGIYLCVKTSNAGDFIGMYARHSVHLNNVHHYDGTREIIVREKYIEEVLSIPVKQGQLITVEKLVAIYTSRPSCVGKHGAGRLSQVLSHCTSELENTLRYSQISETNRRLWRDMWYRSEFSIQGDRLVQLMVRVHTYHLFVTFSHSAEASQGQYGLPARGLSGESYRGHVFWDEVYMFPFYLAKYPSVAKAHLKYRIRLLPAAKEYAKSHGFRGAMIPWQTAYTGEEETQTIHYNPEDQTWGVDNSSLQRHVGIAVFLNAWRYFYETHDEGFLRRGGLAELMFEIAIFWCSITSGPEEDGRYHIHNVMGPDEFHESSGGRPGLSDNAYTNVMIVWLFTKVFYLLGILESEPDDVVRICRAVCLTDDIKKRMKDISEKMYVGLNAEGVIEQFRGFFTLRELPIGDYITKYGTQKSRRIDRILKSEGLSPDDFQITKQPDVLMIFYLLRLQEVTAIFDNLGYHQQDPRGWLGKNYDYYVARCTHGSTLSYSAHARIAHMCNRPTGMWDWFMTAAISEIYDTQGTTGEGIHCAVMAGTLHLLVTIVSGIQHKENAIVVTPSLPGHVYSVKFNTRISNVMYEFYISKTAVRVTMLSGEEETFHERDIVPLQIVVGQVTIKLAPWQPAEVSYAPLHTMAMFLEKMRQTRHVRRRFVFNHFDKRQESILSSTEFHLSMMKNILGWLRKVPCNNKGPFVMSADRQLVNVNLLYEISELEKDIAYMEAKLKPKNDEDGVQLLLGIQGVEVEDIYRLLRKREPNFDSLVEAGIQFLKLQTTGHYHCFITDRDGTINNYGCTYQTCVQSAYNAIFVSSFARRCSRAIILTAAPMRDFVDLTTNLRGVFILAASKGREFQDETGTSFSAPLHSVEVNLLSHINKGITALLQQPHNVKFSQIGSGVQFKHGSTTIARQDTCGSIRKSESESWLKTIRELCFEIAGDNAILHDTGTDIEIAIRLEERMTEFTKGDGLKLVCHELGINLREGGPILVCGDTSSDLPMLRQVMEECPDGTRTIFVTTDPALQEKVRNICSNCFFVPNPDVLVTTLYRSAQSDLERQQHPSLLMQHPPFYEQGYGLTLGISPSEMRIFSPVGFSTPGVGSPTV